MPAWSAISRVAAPANPRSAKTRSAASRMRRRIASPSPVARTAWMASSGSPSYRAVRSPPCVAVSREHHTLRAEPGAPLNATQRRSRRPRPRVGPARFAGDPDTRRRERGTGERNAGEAVVVPDDDRRRLAHRVLEQQVRKVEADDRESDGVRSVQALLDQERPDAALTLRRRQALPEGEALPVV